MTGSSGCWKACFTPAPSWPTGPHARSTPACSPGTGLWRGDYRLGQLRYDLAKLRAHGLVERLGTSRRYRLTPRGLKLGVLLVKLRTRLLGPLVTLAGDDAPRRPTRNPSAVEAAFRQVDAALDHLCAVLGLKPAA
jgi:hypothetical protein